MHESTDAVRCGPFFEHNGSEFQIIISVYAESVKGSIFAGIVCVLFLVRHCFVRVFVDQKRFVAVDDTSHYISVAYEMRVGAGNAVGDVAGVVVNAYLESAPVRHFEGTLGNGAGGYGRLQKSWFEFGDLYGGRGFLLSYRIDHGFRQAGLAVQCV